MPRGESLHFTVSDHTTVPVTIKVPLNDSNVVELVRPDIQIRGDGLTNRTGNAIYVTSILVKGRLSHAIAGDTFIRMSVAWFPSATLDSGFPAMYQSLYESGVDQTQRRKMYFDKYYMVRQVGSTDGGSVNLNVKIPIGRLFKMREGQDTSVGGQDHLAIRWCGDDAVNGSFKGQVIVFFKP